jgi:hypothetical protein
MFSQFPSGSSDPAFDPTLTARLEQAVIRALLGEWKNFNLTFFKGAMNPPTLELSPMRGDLGRWESATRTLRIARFLPVDHPWGVVLEVLKHEMAHQYVHEVLGETDECAHGQAFQKLCDKLGIDGTARGIPRSGQASDGEARIIERVAKLLALAESPNRHEAEAAMAAAQKLMLRYNIDQSAASRDRTYGFRHLGKPTGRVSESERLLAMILGSHFFVEVIWVPVYRPLEGKRGTVLEVCGTEANLDMAEYAHTFLTQTGDRLWGEHKQHTGIRSNKERRVFLAGVMSGFSEKLGQQAREHQQQGLVWVKDADLTGFLRKRHPRIRHVRVMGNPRTDAYAKGKQAGKTIVIHRPVQQGASACETRMLGPGRN